MKAKRYSAPRRERCEGRRAFGGFLFLFLCFSVLLARVFILQIVLGDSMREKAGRQGRVDVELLPWRGTIYDRQFRELALSVSTDSLYLRPGQVRDAGEIIPEVSAVLDIGEEELEEKLTSSSPFVWIRRKVEKHKAEALEMMPGLGRIEESSRFYPGEMLASHVIGFAGMDNYGLEGIELVYDRYLTGIPGALSSRRDARGRETAALRESRVEPDEGHSLVLTVDKLVQLIVEDEIDRVFTSDDDGSGRIRVEGVSVIVMEPATGRVLALANRPAFSPVEAGSFSSASRRNRAVTDVFEPGSGFKVVAAAAALEEGLFSPEDEIFCEDGAYNLAGHTIRDVSPKGHLTFSEVVQKSSNIGMLKIGRELGNARLYEYVRKFGFGEKTGCDLPGEANGLLRHPRHWSGLSSASISFGYEIGVTAIQMAAAYSAIANGGILMRPSVVEAVVDTGGAAVKEFRPEARRRVVSEETAAALTEMLAAAVRQGTGTRARLPGYSAAGKTGTARKLGEDGKYSRTGYVSSFAGFAPAGRPEITVVVIIDEPDVSPRRAYGGNLAAPLFRSIASRTLRYLEVPPEDAGPRTASYESSGNPAGGRSAGRGSLFIEHVDYIVYNGKAEDADIRMPDVRGLRMRDVLRLLSPFGLDVKFHGSGSAARQRPAPGEKIEPGQKCVVVFSGR